MPNASLPASPPASRDRLARRAPFFGLLDCVLVEDGPGFVFEGAISRSEADATWTWFTRDLAPELIDARTPDGEGAIAALEAVLPEVLTRAGELVTAAATSGEVERRLKAQLGGDAVWRRVPVVLNALKIRSLLERAKAFGRATNALADEAALVAALQNVPRKDQAVTALLMQAALGEVIDPGRLMMAATRIAGGASELSIERAGFTPLVEALLAHAQGQLPTMMQWGAFADIDLTCRAVDRFHKLLRAVTGYVELARASRWSAITGALVSAASERIEPHLRAAVPDVSRALRRPREGSPDRIDGDQMLSALNSVYLLATVRECRDSLALNALFDQSWTQVGTAIEQHLERNLEALRQNASDGPTRERIRAGVKMAGIRFNAEYASLMQRAFDSIVGTRFAQAS